MEIWTAHDFTKLNSSDGGGGGGAGKGGEA